MRSNSPDSRKSKARRELRNVTEYLATTSDFMHDWSRHSILSQSRVPLYEKYITVIYALGSAHEENAVWISRRSNAA